MTSGSIEEAIFHTHDNGMGLTMIAVQIAKKQFPTIRKVKWWFIANKPNAVWDTIANSCNLITATNDMMSPERIQLLDINYNPGVNKWESVGYLEHLRIRHAQACLNSWCRFHLILTRELGIRVMKGLTSKNSSVYIETKYSQFHAIFA